MTKQTIEMDNQTMRFYQGVSAGTKVREAHEGLDFPDHETSAKMYWFFVGTIAVAEYECRSAEDFTNFTMGAAVRQPQEDSEYGY